jgi:hypothetical protein
VEGRAGESVKGIDQGGKESATEVKAEMGCGKSSEKNNRQSQRNKLLQKVRHNATLTRGKAPRRDKTRRTRWPYTTSEKRQGMSEKKLTFKKPPKATYMEWAVVANRRLGTFNAGWEVECFETERQAVQAATDYDPAEYREVMIVRIEKQRADLLEKERRGEVF